MPERPTRTAADTLMGPRDGLDDDLPSDDDVELFERVREDSARSRVRRRTVAIAGVALLLLIGALALSLRGPRSPSTATAPTDEPGATDRTVLAPTDSEERTPKGVEPADGSKRAPDAARPIAPAPVAETPRTPQIPAPAPRETAAASSLPERALPERGEQREASARPRASAQRSARVVAPDTGEQRSAPAAMATAAASRPPVRVEVTQTPGDGTVDYSVRVTHPDGTPVTNAAVRLRGVMSDGARVEARLDPAGEPGVYHSLLTFSPRGPHLLTLRVTSVDGILEVPVADPPAGGGTVRQ